MINLLDKDLPFTGIIEATNVVSPEDFKGRHIVYLPKYVTRENTLRIRSDGEIAGFFIEKLRTVFPSLTNDSIFHHRVFRADCVQPLQELNCLNRTVGFDTPIPGVYLANSSMIYNSTLNNNAAITIAQKAVDMIVDDLNR